MTLQQGIVLTAIGFFAVWAYPARAAADALVERQDSAVATNLGLFGGQPLDITVDPTDADTVYVATYTPNGIFYSTDAGTTWNSFASGADYGAGKHVSIDPDTGDAYAIIGDHVLKTTNAGSSWTKLTPNLDDNPIMGAVSIYANNVYMAAASGGALQISTDQGANFTSVIVNGSSSNASSQNVISLAADSAGVFYAVFNDEAADTASVMYTSADNGVSWAELDVEAGGVASGSIFYDIAVDPNDDDHVVLSSYNPNYDTYHSLDAGQAWTVLEQDDGNQLGADEAVFDGNGRLYIGIYYTDNPGAVDPTWTAIEQSTPLSSVKGDIYAINSTDPDTLYTNSGLGVAKSTDAGQTWTDQVNGMTAVQTYSISQANDKDVVWIGATGGLAKTENFTAASPDWEFPILPDTGLSAVEAVWVKPGNSDHVVAGISDYISISTDGGDTWAHANAPAFSGTVQQIVQSPRNNTTLYAVYTNTSLTEDDYNGGVLKSTDAGASWTELDFPSTLASSAIAVAANGDTDKLYVGIGSGGSETGVYTYSAGDWSKLDEDFNGLNVNNILVSPDDSETVFVSCEADSTVGSLFKSTDGGGSWDIVTAGLKNMNHLGVMASQGTGSDTLYMAGQDGGSTGGPGVILKSTDNGDSWSTHYQGKKQEFIYALLFDGLVVGNDRGLYNVKSLGKVKLKTSKVSGKYRLVITLKDAATKDRLSKRQVLIYKKKPGKAWKQIAQRKTTAKGKVTLLTSGKKNTTFKAVWKPGKADLAEYARSTSRVARVR